MAIAKPISTNGSKSASDGDKPRDDKPLSDRDVETPEVKTDPVTSVRLLALENLALQRVVQTITQDPSDDRWAISGMVTEYFGENRLLISTAVRAPLAVEPSR